LRQNHSGPYSDKRYEVVRGHAKLARLKRIVLAGDMDEAGRNHHEEIARRVGKARCWLARWRDGCKDANDTLQKRGRDAVQFAVAPDGQSWVACRPGSSCPSGCCRECSGGCS
jgi:hypothetical protein